MNLFAFSALVNFITSITLGLFVFSKNPKKTVNLSFFLFAFFIAWWSFGYFFWQSTNDVNLALWWSRMFMTGAIFIPISYLYFVFSFLNKLREKFFLLTIGWIVFLFFLFFSFSDLFIKGIKETSQYGLWPQPGILFHPFLLIWSFFVVYATYVLFRAYRDYSGVAKLQIRYILIGMVVGFLGGATNYFLWYGIPIPPIGNILVSAYVGAAAYAILRYRLMDIRVLTRRVYLYFFTALFSYITFYSIAWFYLKTFDDIFHPATFLLGLFIAPSFVFLLYYFYGYLQQLANRYFFAGLYNYQETITRLAYELNLFNDLEHIVDMIMGTFRQAVQLKKAALISYVDGQENSRFFGFSDEEIENFSVDKALKSLLIGRRKILTIEDIYSCDVELAKRLLNKKISAVLPFFSADNLVALALLGEKENRDAFTNEDLALLETLTNQAGTAISNAGLYLKLADFNKTLSSKVEEQTAELKAKAEHLKKLLAMRSEFLDIASHQLRTPVSVILGTISMFHEGSMDKLPLERQQHFVNNIYIKAKKLEQIIRDILNASEMDTGEFIFTPSELAPKDLRLIIDKVIADLKEKAEEKNLALNFHRPTEPLITPVNEEYLEQAIFNLVDNAIIYTQKGQVDISLLTRDDRAIIKIEDTGVGIAEEDRKNLFHKFSRGKKATDMYTDGSGLGLFIAQKIVTGHPQGKIDFSSQVGRGTIFEISLAK